MPGHRRAWWAAALLCALPLAGCLGSPDDDVVTVGAGSDAQQEVLAAVAVEALGRVGVEAELRAELGGTVGLRRAATNDEVDLYWDQTGAAWALGLREQAPSADPVESWERVREADASNGLRWLLPSEADATFALAVREEDVPDDAEATMSWLARELSGGDRPLCADPDFLVRPEGLGTLAEEYAIDLERVPRLPADGERAAVEGVAEGRCFAGLVTATSGHAHVEGLVAVADDLGVLPAFVVAPVLREGSAADREDVVAALEAVAAAMDTQTLARLSAERLEGGDPADVAERFVDEALGG